MWTSVSTKGCRDQQVLQPIVMITVLIEPFGRTPPAVVVPRRRRAPRGEVPQQRPRAAMQPAGPDGAVEVLAIVEVPVHPPHQPVEHVARAVAARMTVRDRPPGALGAEVQDLLRDDPAEVPAGPHPQRAEPLREAPAVGRVVRLPDPPADLSS